MGRFREWLNNNPSVVTVAAVLLLIVALFYMIKVNTGGGGNRILITEWYYYDLGKKGVTNPLDALFVDKANLAPPIDSPSGSGLGVQAMVFGCGDCKKENRFVAYLQKLTPQAKKLREQPPPTVSPGKDASGNPLPPMPPPMMDDPTMGLLVASVEKPNDWYVLMSEPGMKIMSIEGKCPAEKKPKPCFPGK